MVTRVRTIDFLPEIFKTTTNQQFLSATLDQLTQQGNTERIEGYIGSKFGYGINADDKYIVEPNKTRTDYQMDPSVIFLKKDTSIAADFLTYPGLIDGLRVQSSVTKNNNSLFENQFYSWDSFVNLDKLINFSQYYWLQDGPDSVDISTETIYNSIAYTVSSSPLVYDMSADKEDIVGSNPTIALLRGGTYTFAVDQTTQFWIQGAPGVTGYDPFRTNLNTRDVLGVVNNGATNGLVTFTVPYRNAQDYLNFPGNYQVDLISTLPFDQINGKRLSEVGGDIDGITSLDGRTIMFYGIGAGQTGYIGEFFGADGFDTDVAPYASPITTTVTGTQVTTNLITCASTSGFVVNEAITFTGVEFGGLASNITYYIKTINSGTTFTVSLTPAGSAVALSNGSGTMTAATNIGMFEEGAVTVVNDNFYKITMLGDIDPVISLSVVSAVPTEQKITAVYGTQWIGRNFYRTPAGEIELIPYLSTQLDTLYYQDGSVSGKFGVIKIVEDNDNNIIDVERTIIGSKTYVSPNGVIFTNGLKVSFSGDIFPESFKGGEYYVEGVGTSIELIPVSELVVPESFSEGEYTPFDVETFDLQNYDTTLYIPAAKDYLTIARNSIDRNAWSRSNRWFHVDVLNATAKYTNNPESLSILNNTSARAQRPIVEFYPNLRLFNSGVVGKNPIDFIDFTTTDAFNQVAGQEIYYPDGPGIPLFDGARIVFANDTNPEVRNNIYIANLESVETGGDPVITLSRSVDGKIYADNQVVVFKGSVSAGKSYYYTGTEWKAAQLKTLINQPPLFDMFDSNGISLSDVDVYTGSSFMGSKLFSYGVGNGTNDPVLGFPIRYSSVSNIGDISFDVNINLDTFNYVENNVPVEKNINIGFIHKYTSLDVYTQKTGWETAIAPSVQYQIFNLPSTLVGTYVCDIAADTSSEWPAIQVYVNNARLDEDQYTVAITSNTTSITLIDNPVANTPIEILIYSSQTSNTAYYDIPNNLSNNPFNESLTTASVGEIRGHYQSIYKNYAAFKGNSFGANNYRDLGNLVPYGTRIIQSSAPLVLPSAFIRRQNHNLIDALAYNANEYTKFKALLLDTVNRTEYSVYNTSSEMLDTALDQIASVKDNSNAFFWSDMLPARSPYISRSYQFLNFRDTSIFQLSRIYDFESANYFGVLVYLNKVVGGIINSELLIKDVDYTISKDSPSVIVTRDLSLGDTIVIKEYNQTYGSFIPNTPSKLGLYPATIPEVVLDTTYVTPTYFIKGHDGSLTKLYGAYNNGLLEDFRDKVLLEFEKRIFNNIKVSATIPLVYDDIFPGQFRTTDYSYTDMQYMYSYGLLDWAGKNRIDYKSQYYSTLNEFTWNYNECSNKLTGTTLQQGNWRGIYMWLYDTDHPHTAPWEMLGFANKPTWWDARYGEAPYTSDNTVLWNDLAGGINWNNGSPVVIESRIRPDLLSILPVDSAGDLLSPLATIVEDYNDTTFNRDWKIGDVGPAETAYLNSSTWPFDLIRLFALTKPAKLYNLTVDLDRYKYDSTFDQYLFDGRHHISTKDIQVYGSGIAKHSYLNWIVDYEKQYGIDATQNIVDMLNNLDVRLTYRVAGFSDKDMLKFYAEKGTPNSKNTSLLIPDESYSLLLYQNQAMDSVSYSSVIIQKSTNGYTVWGNSQNQAYFKAVAPKNNGKYETIPVNGVKVKVSKEFTTNVLVVPYGAEFLSLQSLAEFLNSYGNKLIQDGFIFDSIEQGVEINWYQIIAEVMYWAQSGWEVGSTINVNPAAKTLKFNKDSSIIQPLTLQQQNFILNQNLVPVTTKDMCIHRDGTEFSVQLLNDGDTISYFTANVANIEHGVVFDNNTMFGDVMYNLITGLRQQRVLVKGVKTAEWNGSVDAQGFILNQDNISEWQPNVNYTKGVIVKYKNNYWTSINVVQPSTTFSQMDWVKTDYEKIQKGLLPNPSQRAFESTLYYDNNRTNLENDADLLGFSLIGYRPRDYLSAANLTDITQINIYKNLIKSKGTKTSADSFKNATLPQGAIDYEVYENWAIKSSEYGGILSSNFLEVGLDGTKLTGNPSIASLTNGQSTLGTQQEIPLYGIKNYGRPITSVNVLPTLSTTLDSELPNAGYVNFDDVKISAYTFGELSNNSIGIDKLYRNDYVWLADYMGSWKAYTPVSLGIYDGTTCNNGIQVTQVVNNLNGTATVKFNAAHGLTKDKPFAIINFDERVNGYYVVSSVIDLNSITIALALDPSVLSIAGAGIGLEFVSQRVDTTRDIANLPLINSEFVNETVWVDEAQDGSWAVYRKNVNYKDQGTVANAGTSAFGSSVVSIPNIGYLASDPAAGKVYLLGYDGNTDAYAVQSIITQGAGFGTSMAYANGTLVISSPSESKIYVYQVIQWGNISTLIAQSVISSVTHTGTIDISGDGKWLYIGDTTNNLVRAYSKNLSPSYASTSLTLNQATVAGADYFITDGDVRSTLLTGTKISFSNATYTPVHTVTTGVYDTTNISSVNTAIAGTDVVTIFDANLNIEVGDAICFTWDSSAGSPAESFGDSGISNGATYYIKEFTAADKSAFKLTTTKGGSTAFNITIDETVAAGYVKFNYSRTIFSVQDTIESAYPESGTTVYIGTTNFTSRGTLTASGLTSGDGFGTAVATNYDGTKVFVGAPTQNYSVSLTDVGYGYVFDRIKENIEVQSDSYPEINTDYILATQYNTVVEVTLNNRVLTPSVDYTTSNVTIDTLNYTKLSMIVQLNAGDLIGINTNSFVNIQTVRSYTDIATVNAGVNFGISLDTASTGCDLLVGAPFDLSDENQEGAVYRFTNSGKRYGTVTGVNTVTPLSSSTVILINGYKVVIPVGNALAIAGAINSQNVPNVVASANDNKLTLSLIDSDLNAVNDKLNVSVLSAAVLTNLGFELYTSTQTIRAIHKIGPTQFGYTVKCNEYGSFAVGAPVATRYNRTTFDFSNDSNNSNDTVFDNNVTQWVDGYRNAGEVYVYDYLPAHNESVTNPGAYVFSQSIVNSEIDYGQQPKFGNAIGFTEYSLIVGAPYYNNVSTGRVMIYTNSANEQNWVVYRQSSEIVDVDRIQDIQLYDSVDNTTLETMDYIDPLQGKLLGAVRQNIDVISTIDPAGYNVDETANKASIVWGKGHVGKIWFDTSSTRFVNYHQNDVVYNSKYFGTVFPGSSVAVYSWIESDVQPAFYQGTGTPYDLSMYTRLYDVDASGSLVTRYYYWVRNTNQVFTDKGKTLPDTIIASYIAKPQSSGIAYFAGLQANTFSLYNAQEFIKDRDTVLHIGYSSGVNDDVAHNEFTLIRQNYADDFLPGLPTRISDTPAGLYKKFIDSLVGVDDIGATVPDITLPKLVRYGVSARPRQSMFVNRFKALENYFTYANNVMAQYPIAEFRAPAFLTTSGEFYDTAAYWDYVNWWAVGFDDTTKSAFEVPRFYDLQAVDGTEGLIVSVAQNSDGKKEVYQYTNNDWLRVGLEKGTIQIKDTLWNYNAGREGFGDNFFDTVDFDQYPSVETRYIIRALNEEIYTNELNIHRNKSLILMFEYIQSESEESQNYLAWLNKTSFIDVSHTIRELKPYEKFQRDNQTFLAGYLNEVKPYHVVIKDFQLKYKGTDVYDGNISDFDLPAQYNSELDKFITPELVYANPSAESQYAYTDSIWNNSAYSAWYQTYGLSITGVSNFAIGKLASYMTTVDTSFYIDNSYGFPVTGTLTIDDEVISYTGIDRDTGRLYGVSRGVNNSVVGTHLPGTQIYIDLSGATVLDAGRGYIDPPKITAWIDTDIYPAPRREARFLAVMTGDKVTAIQVLDPGAGYAVQPELLIEPSASATFTSAQVGVTDNVLALNEVMFKNGDLVYYMQDDNGSKIEGLETGSYYYVGVIQETLSSQVVALYLNTLDANTDNHRVEIVSQGTGTNHKLEMGARASCITTTTPIRQMKTVVKFDRTTYGSQVTEWTPNTFYAGPIEGITVSTSSSNTLLYESLEYPNLVGTGPTHGTIGLEYTISDTTVITNVLTLATGDTHLMTLNSLITFSGTTFGGINADTKYYIKTINSDTTFTVSATAGGPAVTLSTASGTMSARLASAIFTVYTLTTDFYVGRGIGTGTIESSTSSTAVTGTNTSFTTQLEVGMQLKVSNTVLGEIASITDDQNLVLSANASLTGPTQDFTYGPKGTITASTGSTTVSGVGTNFDTQLTVGMILSDIAGTTIGVVESITNATTLVLAENSALSVSGQEYGYGRGVYGVSISSAGQGYQVGDSVIIPGSSINGGGTNNNATVIVTAVGSLGEINTATISGTPNITADQVRHISTVNGVLDITDVDLTGSTVKMTVNYGDSNIFPGQINKQKVKLYQQPTYTSGLEPSSVAPGVTGTGAIFDVFSPLFTTSNILSTYGITIVNGGSGYYDGNDLIHEASVLYIDGAEVGGVTGVNDLTIAVTLTGASGEILQARVSGLANTQIQEYYVKAVSLTEVELYLNSTFTAPVDPAGFVFEAGDYLYLPQPYYVDTSIVTYEDRLYVCTQSNNDATFDYRNWKQINSDDARLNALDRIVAFYKPTDNMPGRDLTQLVKGISYPYNTYLGNPFSPDEEMTLDTVLSDQPFYPIDVDIQSIIWDGNRFVGVADTPSYSVSLTSNDGVTWSITKISDQVISVKDLYYTDGQYYLSTNNQATPLIVSYDAVNWITKGPFTPYDRTDYSDTGFDSSSLVVPSKYLNDTTFYNGTFYAVGDNIIRSTNGVDWDQAYSFGTVFERRLNAITYVSSVYFNGYVAVGYGQEYGSGAGTAAPTLNDISLIVYSLDGDTWVNVPTVTNYGFNSVVAGANTIVTVGDNAKIYRSLNGSNWIASTISGSAITNALRSVVYGPSAFVAVGDSGTILRSTDGITWTQITSSSITSENLNSVTWTGTEYIIAGDNGVILTSTDGTTWAAGTALATNPTTYNVQGPTFLDGYGPEELVSGVVTDDLSMYVKTMPGSAWSSSTYQNNGFAMKSFIATPNANKQISFTGVAETPAQLAVFVIDNTTNIGTRVYEGITATVTNPYTYSIDWITKTITLNVAIPSTSSVMVELYEVGNGKQLARTTTDETPLLSTDGHSYIQLDFPYVPSVYSTPIVYRNGTRLTYSTDYILGSNNGLTTVQFTSLYDPETDFISLTVFGETAPQLGYSVPETQKFLYSGSSVFALTNAMGATNIANAIVEKNGNRLVLTTDYSITGTTLTVTASLTTNDIIAVTSYNDTSNQSLVTDKFTGKTVANITYIDNAANPVTVLTGIPHGLTTGDTVRIDGLAGAVQLNNNTYEVVVGSANIVYLYNYYNSPTDNEPVEGNGVGAYVSGGFIWKDETFTLTNAFDLVDTDRIWVTVDGKRVNSDQLVFNENNNLSILVPIDSSSVSKTVVVTSMTPTATPNRMTYRLAIDKYGVPSVYRANSGTTTWLTQPIYNIDTTIYVNDVTRLVDNLEQFTNVLSSSGVLKAGIIADRRSIVSINVYDATTGVEISSSNYELVLESLAPVLHFTGGVTVGQLLRIVVRMGNILIVNGEKIKFTDIDYATNSISGLIRGVEGTSQQVLHGNYSTVYSILPVNKLNPNYYATTWNSEVYSIALGDPLQISTTAAAQFLKDGAI